MSYSGNPTTNVGLPQWIASDKPTWLGDMNGAFRDIDTAVGTAMNTADSAETLANSANQTAQTASTTANNAQTVANSANQTAQGASTTANNALTTANSANQTAQSANQTAQSAENSVNAVIDKVNGRFIISSSQLAISNYSTDLTQYINDLLALDSYSGNFIAYITLSPSGDSVFGINRTVFSFTTRDSNGNAVYVQNGTYNFTLVLCKLD